jgi:hypothetical protein
MTMWGNRRGWLISLCLVIIVALAVAAITRVSIMSAPAGLALDPSNLTPMALPVSPDEAWPIFTDDADAAPAYRKAIDAWDDSAESAAQQFLQSPDGPPPAALQDLLDARHCKRMRLFAADLPAVVNYQSDHAALEKLFAAGQWASRVGLWFVVHHRPADGVPYLEAAFALGRDLYGERVIFDECQKGLQLMADSTTSQSRTLPRDSVQWASLDRFQSQLDDYESHRIQPIWQVISSVDQQTIDVSAGDVLAFAQRSAEPMWRVEATLQLGRYRFNAGTLGDQVGAARALRTLAADANPAVAAAARAGLALDIQTYRMIH